MLLSTPEMSLPTSANRLHRAGTTADPFLQGKVPVPEAGSRMGCGYSPGTNPRGELEDPALPGVILRGLAGMICLLVGTKSTLPECWG